MTFLGLSFREHKLRRKAHISNFKALRLSCLAAYLLCVPVCHWHTRSGSRQQKGLSPNLLPYPRGIQGSPQISNRNFEGRKSKG